MPTKKGASNKGNSKSYMDKGSKAQIDDIMGRFDLEDSNKEPESIDKVKEVASKNIINNDDEYDFDTFVVEKADEETVAEFNDDEYELGDEKEAQEVSEKIDGIEQEEVVEELVLNIELDKIPEENESIIEESPIIDILSEENPNEEQKILDMDIDSSDEEAFDPIVKTKPTLLEEEDTIEQEEVVEELILNIELDEIKNEEVSMDNRDYNEYADIDNDYLRPMKEAKDKMTKTSKKKTANKKALAQEELEVVVPTTSVAPTVPIESGGKLPIAKPTLKFTPRAAKEYAKIRKKYKINKDRIFSENDYVDGFILARGEMLLRRYDALKVNGGNVGRILITNKRMLFNTSEKAEIPLSSVCGIRSAKYWVFKWAKFVFSLLFMGIAAFSFVYDFTTFAFFADKTWLVYIIIAVGAIFALIGIIFLFTFARRRFALKIFVNAATEFITYNSKRKKKESAIMESVIVAMPGRQIDRFVREVGALIIQSREGYFDIK